MLMLVKSLHPLLRRCVSFPLTLWHSRKLQQKTEWKSANYESDKSYTRQCVHCCLLLHPHWRIILGEKHLNLSATVMPFHSLNHSFILLCFRDNQCRAKVGHPAYSVLPLQHEVRWRTQRVWGEDWAGGRAEAFLLCRWFSWVFPLSEEHQCDIPI